MLLLVRGYKINKTMKNLFKSIAWLFQAKKRMEDATAPVEPYYDCNKLVSERKLGYWEVECWARIAMFYGPTGEITRQLYQYYIPGTGLVGPVKKVDYIDFKDDSKIENLLYENGKITEPKPEL